MKILIISHFFPPSSAVASERIKSLYKYWKEEGHQVFVLTTKKEDPPKDLKENIIQYDYIPVFFQKRIKKTKTKIQEGNPRKTWGQKLFIKINEFGAFSSIRFPDITSFWPFLVDYSQFQQDFGTFDVVVSSHGPYTSHVIAHNMMKKGIGKKWFMDYRDLWTDNYMYRGLPGIRSYERLLENKYLSKADGIVTVSSPLAKKLSKRTKNEVYVIENGFENSEFDSKQHNIIAPSLDKFIISYFGSVYPVFRDPDVIFKAIRSLIDAGKIERNKIEIRFYGTGEELIGKRAKENNVSDISIYFGMVSRDEVITNQAKADALFLLDSSQEKGVLTTKVFEYLNSEKPVLAIGFTAETEMSKLLSQFDYAYSTDDLEEIKKVILLLYSKKIDQGEPYKRTNFDLLHNYSRQNLALKYLKILESA